MQESPPIETTNSIPKNVTIGLGLGIVSTVVLICVWFSIGMYKSSYYSFGPSDDLFLAFVNIPINTWMKYLAIQFYILIKCVLQVVGGDFVYPWINAYIMNPEVQLNHLPQTLYFITNFYWGINSLHSIFFFALAASQVDFGIAFALWSTIGGLVSSYFVIFDEDRKTDTQFLVRSSMSTCHTITCNGKSYESVNAMYGMDHL